MRREYLINGKVGVFAETPLTALRMAHTTMNIPIPVIVQIDSRYETTTFKAGDVNYVVEDTGRLESELG